MVQLASYMRVSGAYSPRFASTSDSNRPTCESPFDDFIKHQ